MRALAISLTAFAALAATAAPKAQDPAMDVVRAAEEAFVGKPRQAAWRPFDLTKVDSTLSALEKAGAETSDPGIRARAAYLSALIRFRAARDDEPARHLKAMRDAAEAKGVPPDVRFSLLCAYRQWDRAYDYWRDAGAAFRADAGLYADPVARGNFYWYALQAANPAELPQGRVQALGSLDVRYSHERRLEIAETGLADGVMPRDPRTRRTTGELMSAKAQALFEMERFAEAEAWLVKATAADAPFRAEALMASGGYWLKRAARYSSDPHKPTLEKAYAAYAEAFALAPRGDRLAALQMARTAVKLGDPVWARTAYADAARLGYPNLEGERGENEFAAGDWAASERFLRSAPRLTDERRLLLARVLYAQGKYGAALENLLQYQKTVKGVRRKRADLMIETVREKAKEEVR